MKTDDELRALAALAEKATPGPWRRELQNRGEHAGVEAVVGATGQPVCEHDEHDGGYGGGQSNAGYIAAASPDIVLDLVERVLKAEAALRLADVALDHAFDCGAGLDENDGQTLLSEEIDAALTAVRTALGLGRL